MKLEPITKELIIVAWKLFLSVGNLAWYAAVTYMLFWGIDKRIDAAVAKAVTQAWQCKAAE